MSNMLTAHREALGSPQKQSRVPGVFFLLFFCVLTLSSRSPAVAQTLYGNLTGSVTDQGNASIPNAAVTVTNVGTGATRTVSADASGVYQLTDLQPGTYDVVISAPSFGQSVTKAVPISANQTKRVDVILAPAGVAQTVEVATAPPALQTDRADVNYEITSAQVTELPTTSSAGRNFQGLYRLVPGIPPPQEQNTQASNPGRTQAVNANGVSNTLNSTKIDGASVAYPWLPALVAYIPPTDSIESANLVTNSFNAEQGTAGGVAVNLIVKSGTNHFHGGAWGYNSISQFNARNFFVTKANVPVIPKNIYNEYGANIGGPILKNKLFFFFDYNQVSLRQYKNGTMTVPLSAVRNGDFSSILGGANGLSAAQTVIYDPTTGRADGTGRTAFPGNIIPASRLSAAALKLLSLTPRETANATASNYVGGAVLAYNRGAYDVKANYNPTDRTTAFARYSVQRSLIVDPPALGAAIGNTWDGGQPGSAPGTVQNVGLGATHAFSPNLLIDANAGFLRMNLAARGPDYGQNQGLSLLRIPGTNGTTDFQSGLPIFNLSNLSALGNSVTSSPFQFRDMQYVGNINLSYNKGAHSMRFGGEYVHSAINHLQTNNNSPRGLFAFNGGATSSNGVTGGGPNYYRTIADLLLGFPQQLGKTVQLFQPNGPRYSTFAFYAQDTWKATQRLTLSYGLRYEFYPFPVRDHTGVFRFDPATSNVLIGGRGQIPTNTGADVGLGQIVPRLGVNYRIGEKTVVRSGFGITVDPESFRYFRDAYPALITLNTVGANAYTPAGALSPASASSPGSNTLPGGNTLAVGIPTVQLPDISSGVVPLPYNYTTVFTPQKFRRGYIESWNLFIDHDLAKGVVLNVGYVGTHHIRQVVGLDINAGVIGGGSVSRPLFANATAPGGALRYNSTILDVLPYGDEEYAGLQTQITDRQLHSFQFGYAYTWSHAMNVYDGNSGTPGGLAFQSPGLLRRNFANSIYDRTHVNALWTVWQMPVGPGRQFLNKGFVGRLVGGFDLNTITSYNSGTPFQITDSSLTSYGDTAVPNQISKPALNGSKFVNGRLYYFQNQGNYVSSTAAPGAPQIEGNLGRHPIRGPGFFNLDVGLTRNIPIFRELQIVLKAESFDVTNTAQFANPSANVQASNFGVITTSNTARSVRFSGRISF